MRSALGWLKAPSGPVRSGLPPVCEPGGPPVVIEGKVLPGDEKTYRMLPFDVRPGTARLDITYGWEAMPPVPPGPADVLTQTVLDLGLWDAHGYRSADGFRGWSGDRHKHVFVQGDDAERGYRPGPINPGVWHVDLGVGAVGPTGAAWKVKVQASRGLSAPAPQTDPVDASHVARAEPGWYHGDFHMHAWHSHPKGPEPGDVVRYARAAHLDFLPITEYVTNRHWDEWGAVQRAHPDLVIWPGREIVTYFGHVQSLGETPGFVEFRHGFEDVTIRDIQAAVRAAGALFGVNHPTTFPGPLFRAMCRGCAFELGDQIDWDAVDTLEVLTGEALVRPSEYGMPDVGVPLANPFSQTAIDLWESLLSRGHRITAVAGSDDKLGPRLGGCATAVYARELSRAGIVEAVRAGRAYVRTRGVERSPALELATLAAADAPGREPGTFGSTLPGGGEFHVTVTGGRGQILRLIRNGDEAGTVVIAGDPFEHVFRVEGEGWARVETLDGRGRTTIGNPVFLQWLEREAADRG